MNFWSRNCGNLEKIKYKFGDILRKIRKKFRKICEIFGNFENIAKNFLKILRKP